MSITKKSKKIGILTAGGDCPGLNAAIRGVGKTAIVEYGMEVLGFNAGFLGLINGDYIELKEAQLSGILTLGGTILGTSREKPYKLVSENGEENHKPEKIIETYKNLGLDAVVCIGGNGTMKTADLLSKEGLNIIDCHRCHRPFTYHGQLTPKGDDYRNYGAQCWLAGAVLGDCRWWRHHPHP
ncbi:MAG: hypothetical protein FD181_1597 [Prolixibacteraceae bacterium]|nr:MAG: hypothetical protein FD181_1597 [Prolixibacteraceae bacterium]